MLSELNPPGVDPPAPENTLIFATGPLGNSMVWGSCRYGVFTKSPLTGLFCESYAGGKAPDAIDAYKDHAAAQAYKKLGTPMLVRMTNAAGAFPTRYWQQGSCRHWEKISAEALLDRCSVKPNACAK